jgi:hypothetical protein
MPVFQSATARVSVFQNGVEVGGQRLLPGSCDSLIGPVVAGTVTIKFENRAGRTMSAHIIVGDFCGGLKAIPADGSHEFIVNVDASHDIVSLRWTGPRRAELYFDFSQQS